MHKQFSLHSFLYGGRRFYGVALSQPSSPSSHLPLRAIQGNRRPHVELQICGSPAKVQSTWDLYAGTKCILIYDTFKITIIDGKKGWTWRERLVLVVDQYLLESIVCTFPPYFWAWMYCWDMS